MDETKNIQIKTGVYKVAVWPSRMDVLSKTPFHILLSQLKNSFLGNFWLSARQKVKLGKNGNNNQ